MEECVSFCPLISDYQYAGVCRLGGEWHLGKTRVSASNEVFRLPLRVSALVLVPARRGAIAPLQSVLSEALASSRSAMADVFAPRPASGPVNTHRILPRHWRMENDTERGEISFNGQISTSMLGALAIPYALGLSPPQKVVAL